MGSENLIRQFMELFFFLLKKFPYQKKINKETLSMELSEKQVAKLDNLEPKDVSEKVLKIYLNTWKIVQGIDAEKNFQYEYDEIFDEYDKVCEVSLEEFKTIAPTIYKTIGDTKSNKIYHGIKNGLLTHGLTLETNVNKKIEEIKENKNGLLSAEKIKIQIAKRKTMFKEGQALEEKGVKLTKGLAWKIWRIEEGLRTMEFVDEEKLEKNKAVVRYLGEDFMNELKKINKELNGY